MRIHDKDTDQTRNEVDLYLTTGELARLYGLLGGMINDIRVRKVTVNDDGFDHIVNVHHYSEHETVGFDERQKAIITEDN